MDQVYLMSFLLLLNWTGFCRGQEIVPEGPVDSVLGKNVTLKTLVEKSTYTAIIWNHNNGAETTNVVTSTPVALKINEVYQGRLSLDTSNGFLTLGPLRSEDSGDYSVTLLSSTGAALVGEIKLRVLEPVSDVVIKSNLPEAIEHNSTVVLTCSAKGSFLKFKWINGSSPITADSKRITLKEEELSSQLTITGVLRSDLVGPIYCSAGNKLEVEKSAPFNLTVYYGPEDITLTPPKTPKVIQSGSNFSLSCTAVSSPPATFTWYHSQKKMVVSGPVLTLQDIEKQKLGKMSEDYTCMATNAKTLRTVSSPAVSITVMDPISSVTVNGPTAVLIAGNGTANISCHAAAGVVKTTTWLKDGMPLAAGGRIGFAADKSSVMIKPLQKDDNGEYTCQLSNLISKRQASFKMVVNYGPEAVTVTGTNEVELHDTVTLTCSAASVPPANFTWKFNGTMTDIKASTYVIEEAVYKNNGIYTCEVHNAVTGGNGTSTHTLSVRAEGELDGLSDGAIAGIIIAILVTLGAAIGLIMYCRQKVPVESPY